MPATVYQASLRRTVLLALGALGFVAISAWLLATHQSIVAEITGAVGVPFFSLAAATLIYRLIRRGPELVITDEGFAYRTWGSVAWSEVRAVRIREIKVRGTTQRMIEVVLRDPDAYVDGAPVAARMLMRANRRAGFSPINISAVILPVSLHDVLAAMKRHQPNLIISA
ncbi:STM3941 family protein [Dactylosporangium sp. NPDC000244]|uniref:STM3941 family protein n=1 Tax=Dactylosporangium sp. NPDC000244 TaxID=3154365 RepID=UPI00332F9813